MKNEMNPFMTISKFFPISDKQIDENLSLDFQQALNFMVPLCSFKLGKLLKVSQVKADNLLKSYLDNIFGATTFDLKGSSVDKWYELVDLMGYDYMKRNGYIKKVQHFIPDRYEPILSNFLGNMVFALREIYTQEQEWGWSWELFKQYGNTCCVFSDWLKLKKDDLVRAVDKLVTADRRKKFPL